MLDVLFATIDDKTYPRSERIRMTKLKYEWNQCVRHCHLCGKVYTNSQSLWGHMRNIHNIMSVASVPTHVEGDIEVNHACLLCDKVLKFETAIIKNHVWLMHKTRMKNYEEQFSAELDAIFATIEDKTYCLLYTSPSPRDLSTSRMPSSA